MKLSQTPNNSIEPNQADDLSLHSTLFANTVGNRQSSLTTMNSTNNFALNHDTNKEHTVFEDNLQKIKSLQQTMKEELTSRYIERRNKRFLTSRRNNLGPAKRASTSAISASTEDRYQENDKHSNNEKYSTQDDSNILAKQVGRLSSPLNRQNRAFQSSNGDDTNMKEPVDYSSIEFGELTPFEYLKKHDLPTSELPYISRIYFEKQKLENRQTVLRKRRFSSKESLSLGTTSSLAPYSNSKNNTTNQVSRDLSLPRRKISDTSSKISKQILKSNINLSESGSHGFPPDLQSIQRQHESAEKLSRAPLIDLNVNNVSPKRMDKLRETHKFSDSRLNVQDFSKKTDVVVYEKQAPRKKVEIVEPKRSHSKLAKRNTITVNDTEYEKIELLGRGGSSRVYKVKNSQNKVFALKRVSFDEFDDSSVDGFKGEIELLEKLSNESRVVKLFDYQMDSGVLFLIMECGDHDLSQILSQRSDMPLDMDFVRYHAREVVRCIKIVHDAGIVHSDLKPANFVFVKGILKIIDFGIANAIPDHTVNIYRENQIGTPNYMAPEALVAMNYTNENDGGNKWKVGKPSDIWSCGCIIYQMIYGRPPYAGFQGQNRLLAIMNPDVKVIFSEKTANNESIPRSLIDLMKGCLTRDPEKRWSVDQVLESPFFNPIVVTPFFIKDLIKNAVRYGVDQREVSNEKIEELANDVLGRLTDFKM